MNSTKCPKCGDKLNILQPSNRQICPSCKWTNQKVYTSSETEKKKVDNSTSLNKEQSPKIKLPNGIFSDRSNALTGKVFFLLGLATMVFGLSYNTTVCDDSSSFSSICLNRTHNLGLLNTRSNIVNIGGFLCVAGSILLAKFKNN